MDKFGFIVHPPDMDSLYRHFFKPGLRRRSDALVEKVLEWTPPFKLAHVTGVRSEATGKEIEGYLIACPLLAKQFLELDLDFILKKITDACKIAQDLGARIVGLGAFASVVGDQGKAVAKNLDIPVTTGNSYTAATVIEGVMKAAEQTKIDLSRTRLAILGATGSIGNVCARILAKCVSQLVLSARSQERLVKLADTICASNQVTVEIAKDPKQAVIDADIVIATTSATEALIGTDDLKAKAIVCDVAVPRNVSLDLAKRRKDVVLFEGGIVKPPGNVRYAPPVKLFDSFTYACAAETMVLTLEEKFECYSLGRSLPLSEVYRISDLAEKHGFKSMMTTLYGSNSIS